MTSGGFCDCCHRYAGTRFYAFAGDLLCVYCQDYLLKLERRMRDVMTSREQ